MKSIKSLWNFMKGSRTIYLFGIISIILATFFTVLTPLFIRTTIDSIIGDTPISSVYIIKIINFLGGREYLKEHLWVMGGFLISLTLLRGIFLYYKSTLSSKSSEKTAKKVRDELYDHIQKLPYEYHVKADTGELIQRCTSDVETVRKFLAVQLVEIGGSIFTLIFVSYIMFNLNVKMTMVSMIAVPIIFVFAVVFFSKVKVAFEASDVAEGKMSTVLQENLTGIRVVKAFAREKYEIGKFDEKNKNYKDLTYRLIKLLAWYWGCSDFLCMMQIGAVLIVGSLWTSRGNISLGTLVAFVSYEEMLLWPVRQMGRVLTDMGKAFVSLKRIGEIFSNPIEIMEENHEKPRIEGNVSFNNVYFEYEKNKPILNNITFDVKKGETVAILGPTGSGKSSLVYLLARLYEYKDGSITIDGIELNKIDKKWIRKNVGIVLQEPFLFAKTVKENIKLSNPMMDDRKVFEAAKVASIHKDILSFENGYETAVGERGVSLSGGQKQRIAIARTIINECPIVVFDDSLSAVDTETDISIRKSLNLRRNLSTTFIISHRISTVCEADKIIVLDKGNIVQQGTHYELLKEDGLYKRIYDIQSCPHENYEYEMNLKNA
ncbi:MULTISPECIES: ABC transporter ATP-binding protein [Tissierellales]|uniref:ABC transporter ATP-binding protein n=1 Tax=Acidilutibacter cellobiosedens TaxID=2507161 RepID=A0A410QF51_9FIRM|nr:MULTISPECIES: ABC transporter ATP-binding protein [Tissierellales]QAT62627.1 ABC transporter ATP-binding protein [Acidilutibacter cellobiosedens]